MRSTPDEKAARWYAGLQSFIGEKPTYAPLGVLWPADPATLADPTVAKRMHRAARSTIAWHLDETKESLVVRAVADYQRTCLGVPPLGARRDDEIVAAAVSLDRDSHALLPPVADGDVADMVAYFRAAPAHPGDRVPGDPVLPIDQARQRSGIARYPAATVMACPHLLETLLEPRLVSAVARHLGAMPTVLGFNAWWSFAISGEAERTQRFHWDGAFDYRYCTGFTYLTDVGEEDGPTAVIPGSHSYPRLRSLQRSAPIDPEAFRTWFHKPGWKDDGDIAALMPMPPITITGSAGTRYLINTRGLHRGYPPRRADRLMCQAIFGLTTESQVTDVAPRPAQQVRPGGVPAWLFRAPFDYVTRLFIEHP